MFFFSFRNHSNDSSFFFICSFYPSISFFLTWLYIFCVGTCIKAYGRVNSFTKNDVNRAGNWKPFHVLAKFGWSSKLFSFPFVYWYWCVWKASLNRLTSCNNMVSAASMQILAFNSNGQHEHGHISSTFIRRGSCIFMALCLSFPTNFRIFSNLIQFITMLNRILIHLMWWLKTKYGHNKVNFLCDNEGWNPFFWEIQSDDEHFLQRGEKCTLNVSVFSVQP